MNDEIYRQLHRIPSGLPITVLLFTTFRGKCVRLKIWQLPTQMPGALKVMPAPVFATCDSINEQTKVYSANKDIVRIVCTAEKHFSSGTPIPPIQIYIV